MMGAARAAVALLLFLIVLPMILEVFPGFFRDVFPGESTTPGESAVLNILLFLFLIGLVVRLNRRLKHDDSRGGEAAKRRERIAPRYRAENVPAPVRPHPEQTDDDPELDLSGQ